MRFGVIGSLVLVLACVGLIHCDGGSSADGGDETTGGGTGPRGGNAGTNGGGAAAPQGGAGSVCQSTSELVSTVPFTLSIGEDAGEGGAGGVGGASDGGGASRAQGCSIQDTSGRKTCSGSVVRTQTGFIFDDGSTLTWTGAAYALPLPETPAGVIPWVQYDEQYFSNCPFCGGTTSKAISILASAGGQVLYVGSTIREPLEDPSVLFDAAFELEPKCDTAPYNFDCYTVVDHRFDVVIGTDPVQRIPYGERTRIDVPGGTFDIFWSNADANSTLRSGCFDGRVPDATREFAALRVSE